MPYAQCISCNSVLTRPGSRGVKLSGMCCVFCGGDLKTHATPVELYELRYRPYDKELLELYDAAPKAQEKWLYDARKGEAAWMKYVQGSLKLSDTQVHHQPDEY